MENLLVVKNLVDVYTPGATTIEEVVGLMVPHDLLVVGDGKSLIGLGQVVPDGISEVQFLVKLNDGSIRSTVSIPRANIRRLDTQMPTTEQLKVLRIGGTAVGTGLVIPSTGEANLLIKNLSYNHSIATQRVSLSVQKKATETAEAFIDRVVAEGNAAMSMQAFPFATLAKVGGGADFAITFTVSNTNVDLSVGVDGIFSDYPAEVITEMKIGLGKGTDLLAMEKEMSRHLGNGNYEKNPDLWYKAGFQINPSDIYNVATLNWAGIAPTPTNTYKVAENSLTICISDSVGEPSEVYDVLKSIVGTKVQTNIDAGEDATDGTEDENVADPIP